MSKHDFKLCSLNVRSINNKTLCIREFIIDNNLDILFLCETWLGTDYDETSISEFLPPGYKLLHQARTNNNNNNNICLKSNIQTSSVDYAPRELTHACSRSETCSRSDTEACDMCYVF